MSSMYCFQCEQTAKETACTSFGVCGKDPDTARIQDAVVTMCKGVAQYAHAARQLGARDRQVDIYVVEGLFTTVTNVNFDAQDIVTIVEEGKKMRERARQIYESAARDAGRTPEPMRGPAAWEPGDTLDEILRNVESEMLEPRVAALGRDVAGLQELILYGLKGMSAYTDHAMILGVEDDEVYAYFHEALASLAHDPADVEELVGMVLRTGQENLKVLELLDTANTGAYGHPEPTQTRVTPVAGKCIAVSGHDLKDLEELLKQTEGTGINVYTHCEMLPATAYPGLKKYKHLVGNYGGAWQDQAQEFDAFPGAILMTTNCIQKPRDSYKDRIFTSGLVQWPGVRHISDRDFTPVLEAAKAAPGFTEDAEEKRIPTGFAHNTVLGVAEKVLELVNQGKLRRIFLIGGCDGAKTGRNYYTRFAEQVPEDCMILTLACGKFRFNKIEFGEIEGLPRLLDCGQCNDAYSAIKIAQTLAETLHCGVNDLPLSFILSWYEQKAVCILLTLLYLGVRDMKLGPSLPAFVGPNVLQVLVDKFDLQPIATVEEDLRSALA